ncbi:MAG: ABC transporter substrate-binding protein [Chitinispirillia bacterium]|jgi:peptide/nickel transport system substrate-binding protein
MINIKIVIINFLFCLLVFVSLTCDQKAKEVLSNGYKDSCNFDYSEFHKKSEKFIPEIGKKGGILYLPLYSEPVSFNPVTTINSDYHIYEGLIKIDGITGEPRPHIADKWDVSDDSLSWTFFIHKGILWSDSTPLTAYDVQFTFNDLIYSNTVIPNPMQKKFFIDGQKIKISVLDTSAILFNLQKPYAPFLLLMSQEILPEHICKKLVKEKRFNTSLTCTGSPDLLIGCGPFIFDSYHPLNFIKLRKNPLYWKKDSEGNSLPYIDTLQYVIMSDYDNALQSFQRKEIDYLVADGKAYSELKDNDSTFNIYHMGPAFESNFILINQNSSIDSPTGSPYISLIKQGWFRNTMFRKALAHSINREKIINDLLNGRGYRQWSPVNPAVEDFYNGSVAKYPYDINKAASILRNSGFDDRNNDGYIEDPDGNIVEFSIVVNHGNIIRQKTAEILISDLKQLGMRVHLSVVDNKTLSSKLLNPPYEWDMAITGINEGVEPHLGVDIWHSTGPMHFWFPKQEQPSTPWETKIDSLFMEGISTFNREKRAEIYHEWQRIVALEVPLIFTVRNERIICMSKRVGNCNPTIYGGLLHNIETLFIK